MRVAANVWYNIANYAAGAEKERGYMIDIHCHILPNIDDGSSSLEESVAMARLAAASGVTEIIATPHFRGEPESLQMVTEIMDRVNRLRRRLEREEIPVKIHPGVEVLCTPRTPEMGANRRLPTLASGGYVLTEFYFDESGAFMSDILSSLKAQGYSPVVAHPERYEAVQRDIRLPREWFDRGYVLQINKGSVLGAFGSRVQQTAEALLRNGLAHVIASDAHGANMRTPHMRELMSWVSANLGPEYGRILLEENPARIVAGQPTVPVD